MFGGRGNVEDRDIRAELDPKTGCHRLPARFAQVAAHSRRAQHRRGHQLQEHFLWGFKSGCRQARMQWRLLWQQLSDHGPAYRLGGTELTRVLYHHKRDVIVRGHAPARGKVRQTISPTQSELQAEWQPSSSNLIQQIGHVLSISVNPLYPDSVE